LTEGKKKEERPEKKKEEERPEVLKTDFDAVVKKLLNTPPQKKRGEKSTLPSP